MRGFYELCPGCVAVLEDRDDRVLCRVLCAEGSRCWEDAVDELGSLLGLDHDYSEPYAIFSSDPILRCIPTSLPGYRLRLLSVWSALLVAVCQQNASFRQGWGMLYRLYTSVGRRLIVDLGEEKRVFIESPRPENLSIEAMKSAGMGYRAETVSRVIEARLHEVECSDVDRLSEVKGVGSYTLNLVKLLACRDYSALPLDRWLRRLAAEAYGCDPREAERELEKRFGRWRGLAALMTTVALDAEPLTKALERLRRGDVCPGKVVPSPVTMWRFWRV